MTPSNDFLDNLAADQHEKMLREIANDDLTPKKRDKKQETEIFENEIPQYQASFAYSSTMHHS